MSETPFSTRIDPAGRGLSGPLSGPWRTPHNMLAEQTYDNHTSFHDDATAQKLGFKGGAVEGPTHFSQLTPLGVALFGAEFLARGCLSAHYRAVVYDGEEVQAFAGPRAGDTAMAPMSMLKRDGTEVLRGTMSLSGVGQTALDKRLAELPALPDPVILRDVVIGYRTAPQKVRMEADQHMGDLYPFSLNQKLAKITENSDWYSGTNNPYGRPIVPFEMISVLLQYTSREDRMPSRGPAIGLFADQEIKLLAGPLFVAEDYEVVREVVAITGSRRTESMWMRTEVRRPGDERIIATMLLNHAIFKDSYAPYAQEHAELYPG